MKADWVSGSLRTWSESNLEEGVVRDFEPAKLQLTGEIVAKVLEAVPDAMVVVGADGRIVRVNTQAERLFGYSREELLGQKPDLLIPQPPSRGDMKQRVGHATNSGFRPLGHDVEVVARRRDGTEFAAEMSQSVMGVGAETLVLSVIRAIEPKQREGLYLSAIVQASEDAVIGKTLDGTIVSWNKGAEKIYGYKAEEILGHSISILLPPGKPDELPAIMKQLRRGQRIESYETTRVHKDGHLIDVSVTISPVKNKAGKVVGASVVARDIKKSKRAEAALRLSEERLRVALKNAPVVVFTQDLQLRYTWITPPVMTWDHRNYIGYTDVELFGEQGARLMAIKQKVLRSGVGYHDEFSITFEGVTRYWDLVIEPFRDA